VNQKYTILTTYIVLLSLLLTILERVIIFTPQEAYLLEDDIYFERANNDDGVNEKQSPRSVPSPTSRMGWMGCGPHATPK
jgi:hypothetical protein